MSSLTPASGVQVVFVEEDGTYRVDEAALRRVVQHEAVRGLPVAVASVAGATRGGKSFLLDFFLRYLRASEEARRSGAWLGAPDEPLTGFSWRGGWKRNTTGILLWSEPIIVTQEVDGRSKKIAVLLMDTQGTFDNTSTVKDCTTIFAMSTLLSSVQIYNLSEIIREDDLQHLQLFTEYGKLASTEDGKPFQSLIFRVRDWMCKYEHPYGAQGGESYLNTVLQVKTKKKEIQDLREHIRSSFENVSCFLTPHPGMAITDQNFSGRLCDLLPEFRESLLEFVPFILHPSKLIPKIINGQVVKAGELPAYFQSYINTFNSEENPTPVSILQATSLACLETALSVSREEYCGYMDRSTSGDRVPRAALPRLHAAALQRARTTFAARRTLAAPALAAERLNTLLQELNAMLPNYVAINHAKITAAVADARAAYSAAVAGVRRGRALCVHARDAPVLHAEASAAAMARFGPNRLPQEEKDDPDRHELLQWLDAKGQELHATNELNNAAARASAAALYAERARRASGAGALGAARLLREHGAARDAALEAFRAARIRASAHSDEEDSYLNELISNIDEQFERWESSNTKSNRSAMRVAVSTYSSRMSGVWGPHACLHPRALRREHAAALRDARAELRAESAAEDGSDEERQLEQTLEDRFCELERMNNASNESLVAAAHAEYSRRMDAKCAPSLASILVVPWLLKVLVQLPQHHERARGEAVAYFHARRRGSSDEDEDEYLEALNRKLSEGYDVYCNPLIALARELNLPTP